METITIPVEGMTCGGCVSSVERALGRLTGVSKAKAELSAASVQVRFDPEAIDVPALVRSIEDAGYAVPETWQHGR